MEELFHQIDDDNGDENESQEDDQSEVTIKYDDYHRLDKAKSPTSLSLALVSKHHSLWAEFIYNAARLLADLIDGTSFEKLSSIDVSGKKCLELGAGAGLPGVLAALNGAKEVVISDYGHNFDLSLIYPIDINLEKYRCDIPLSTKLSAVGYIWGYPAAPLIDPFKYYHQNTASIDTLSYAKYQRTKLATRFDIENSDLLAIQVPPEDKFDIIFAADLLFNRSEHRKLLWTIKECIKPTTGVCYVSFSHHDPDKAPLDLNFFTLASSEEFGFTVDYIGFQKRQSYPFREQDGKDDIRGQIHLYTLTLL